MKHLIIGKDVNYAASKTSTTTETATNPQLLRDGAIGIYTDTGTLIRGGSAANARTDLADVKRVVIAVGTADSVRVSAPIDRRAILNYLSKDYEAPVAQISFVGFNATSGSLNSGTIAAGDIWSLLLIGTTAGVEPLPRDNYEHVAKTGDTGYEILSSMAQANAQPSPYANHEVKVILDVISNGTATAFVAATQYTGTGTPTISITKGTKTLTVASTTITAWDLADGSLIRISGGTYKQVSSAVASDVATITLDRVYPGTTLAAAAVSTTSGASLATVTEYGLKITAANFGEHFRVAADNRLADATVTQANDTGGTPFNPGSGTYAQISALEKEYAAVLGYWDQTQTYRAAPGALADSTSTYDYKFIKHLALISNKDGMRGQTNTEVKTIVAFVNAGSNSNQSAFEIAITEVVNWTTAAASPETGA